MHHHRFREQLAPSSIPRLSAPTLNPSAFCACPMNLMVGAPVAAWPWQQMVYQIALREAQAVVRPSLLERDLLGVWN